MCVMFSLCLSANGAGGVSVNQQLLPVNLLPTNVAAQKVTIRKVMSKS